MNPLAETEPWSDESFGSGALDFCVGLLSRFARTGPSGAKSPSPSKTFPPSASDDSRTTSESGRDSAPSFEDASEALRGRIEGIRALAVVGLDGRTRECILLDSDIRPETLSELAMLVRIADRTTTDAGLPGLAETTWCLDSGTVLCRRVGEGQFLLLIGEPTLPTSLARYILRQAARGMHSAKPVG